MSIAVLGTTKNTGSVKKETLGFKIQSLPEIVISPAEAASKDSITVPAAEVYLNSTVPVPLTGTSEKVIVIFESGAPEVAPSAGTLELHSNHNIATLYLLIIAIKPPTEFLIDCDGKNT